MLLAAVSYLPIGGGAEGRGGCSSGYLSMLGLWFKVSGFLATGYWLLATRKGSEVPHQQEYPLAEEPLPQEGAGERSLAGG